MIKTKATLQINKLALDIHLGWTKKERSKKRRVLLDATIFFPRPPKACLSDELADSICYRELTDGIKALVAKKEFALIEYLASEIFDFIKTRIPSKFKVEVTITKFPAIKNLKQGVSFCYGDK